MDRTLIPPVNLNIIYLGTYSKVSWIRSRTWMGQYITLPSGNKDTAWPWPATFDFSHIHQVAPSAVANIETRWCGAGGWDGSLQDWAADFLLFVLHPVLLGLSTAQPLITETCQDDNFVVIESVCVCCKGKRRCRQWRQCWHLDDARFSVRMFVVRNSEDNMMC